MYGARLRSADQAPFASIEDARQQARYLLECLQLDWSQLETAKRQAICEQAEQIVRRLLATKNGDYVPRDVAHELHTYGPWTNSFATSRRRLARHGLETKCLHDLLAKTCMLMHEEMSIASLICFVA